MPAIDTTATATDLPDDLTRGQVDDQPLSPVDETKGKLEKLISHRPDERELVEKNIMKDTKVAPALQAHQEELKRAQLENKLDNAIKHRPQADELVKGGILTKDEAPDAGIPPEKVEPPSIA
ncbi:hypothetical protein P389DRAFT_43008 [Cystobasidium minutum MCA 4210]|uniref:uncharacterized protein n=1 Tax=Cystobasidium minutum MCA 4210 TaxID=1397322 RepID=UPI0034CF13A8|eukprot:jgi/Rhomi1/43008/CE43007_751